MNTKIIYPPMPLNADESVIKPSDSFRKSVINVLIAMILFVVTYVLLIIGAVAIGIAFGFLGISLMAAVPNFFTFILGCGLIASGLLLVYFLIKVIFKRKNIDDSRMVEITQEEQPELFDFIRQLTQEVKSPFPKKVFITEDVNAGVFYNPNFWSMFFPVRKNLKIGLGLVNSLNMSEFKAVMAHEFGHFSQRSMKFGSYVYNMNKIMYNILFDNEGYNETANVIAKMHYLVRFCVIINIYLIRGIQAILRKMYVFVNKKNLVLSREMEFHADAIAGYVSGSNQAINCLRKSEMAQVCYQSLFNYLNGIAEKSERPANIYPHHIETMKFFAETNRLNLDGNGLPVIEKQLATFNNTNIVVEDQWSSHPTHLDREEHLKTLNLDTPTVSDRAWSLFRSPEILQKQLTDILYSGLVLPHVILDQQTVSNDLEEKIRSKNYNNVYRGFYNDRYLTEFDLETATNETIENITFDELFNDENCNTPAAVNGIKTDIQIINNIVNSSEIKTFDYKGVKYYHEDAENVKEILSKDLIQNEEKLAALDKRVFKFFYYNSNQKDQIKDIYKSFFQVQIQTKQYVDVYDNLVNEVNPIFSTMKFADIENTVSLIYNREEELKPILQQFISDETYNKLIPEADIKSLEIYLSKKWIYFSDKAYDEPSIQLLTKTMQTYFNTVSEYFFISKKKLTDLQLTDKF